MKSKLSSKVAIAHANGAQAARLLQIELYGTRPTPHVDAGDAVPARAATGAAIPSVWNGPRKIRSGAPVLKRDRSA